MKKAHVHMMNVASEKSGIVKRCQKGFSAKFFTKKKICSLPLIQPSFTGVIITITILYEKCKKVGHCTGCATNKFKLRLAECLKITQNVSFFEIDNSTCIWCNEHTVCSISIVWPLLLSNLHTCSCKSVVRPLICTTFVAKETQFSESVK